MTKVITRAVDLVLIVCMVVALTRSLPATLAALPFGVAIAIDVLTDRFAGTATNGLRALLILMIPFWLVSVTAGFVLLAIFWNRG